MKFYNMSAEENRRAYGSEEPPAYVDKFRQISTPVRLWSTEADVLVSTKVRSENSYSTRKYNEMSKINSIKRLPVIRKQT